MSINKYLLISTIFFLGFFGLAGSSQADTHYVTPTGVGSKNGNDWSNAYQGLPASLTRGDTYVIAGGSYSAKRFNDNESGSTYIYIRKASSSDPYNDHLIAGWSSSYETNQAVFSGTQMWTFNKGYYDIDGITPTTKWQTSGYGIKVSNPGTRSWIPLIAFNGGASVIIRRIEIANAGSSYDFEQYGLGGTDEGALPSPNVTVQYCYFHDNQNHIRILPGNNFTVEYCYFGPNWSTNNNHGVGFNYRTPTSGHIFRYNYVNGADVGTGCHCVYAAQSYNDFRFFGNIYINMNEGGNGTFGDGDSSTPSSRPNWKIYNNTFINSSHIFIYSPGSSIGWEIKNNLFYGSVTSGGVASATFSNNYHNNTTYSWTSGAGDVTSTESTSILFKNYAGGDYHIGNLNSQAVNAGTNLGSPYNVDADSVSRPQGLSWDIGAYEYVEITPDTTPPSAPSGLSVN